MNVKKQVGRTAQVQPDSRELELINRFSRKPLEAQEVYTFAVRLCDNEIDRDGERFEADTLEELAKLFVGKTGIFDHQWTAAGQTARLYRTEVVEEPGVMTAAGDMGRFLKGYAYVLRTPGNEELIAQLEGGILREVSVGCAVKQAVCSVCGKQAGACAHRKGEIYDGELCYTSLRGAADAFEWSFVAVPAQPKAGVLKHKGYHAMKELAGKEGWAEDVEQLEKQAELGRRYLAALRREVVRLNGLTGEGVEHGVMERIADRLGEGELLELRRVYAEKAAKRYPVMTQLGHGGQEREQPADGAFLI
ncbi:MAG: hypothetical protein E7450_06375 [Ruminococcaceae bacterium]|nr:hypothetical protein [Oscillospiraceae bacterium]